MGGEWLVVHFDLREGFLGHFRAGGRHSYDFFTDKANLVYGQDVSIWHLGPIFYRWHVVGANDCLDSRQGGGFRRVDIQDPGVRIRTP